MSGNPQQPAHQGQYDDGYGQQQHGQHGQNGQDYYQDDQYYDNRSQYDPQGREGYYDESYVAFELMNDSLLT